MLALSTLDGGRVTLAVGSLGAAQRALDLSVDYLRQNQGEGGNLSNRQSIQWKLADIAMEVYASKFMCYNNLVELEKYYEIIESKEKVPRQYEIVYPVVLQSPKHMFLKLHLVQ